MCVSCHGPGDAVMARAARCAALDLCAAGCLPNAPAMAPSPGPQNVASGEWRRIEPVGRAPLGRDHHSAAFHNGSMFVFGKACTACLPLALACILECIVFCPQVQVALQLGTQCAAMKAGLCRPAFFLFECCIAQAMKPCCVPCPCLLPTAGRSGARYCGSRPLNSLWRFDLAARTWTHLRQTRDAKGRPLPRFEHSYTQVTPPGSSGAWPCKAAAAITGCSLSGLPALQGGGIDRPCTAHSGCRH